MGSSTSSSPSAAATTQANISHSDFRKRSKAPRRHEATKRPTDKILSSCRRVFVANSLSREIRFGRGFVFQRDDLVRIETHHQIGNVVVDLRVPVTGARGNHDDVASLQVMFDAVLD